MLYLDLKSAEDGCLRERRRAQIIVKGYSPDDENDICLSAQCASYSEVERDVNFLKRELDQVLAQARKKFLGQATTNPPSLASYGATSEHELKAAHERH